MPSIISFEKQDAFIASETEKQNNKEKKKKKGHWERDEQKGFESVWKSTTLLIRFQLLTQ